MVKGALCNELKMPISYSTETWRKFQSIETYSNLRSWAAIYIVPRPRWSCRGMIYTWKKPLHLQLHIWPDLSFWNRHCRGSDIAVSSDLLAQLASYFWAVARSTSCRRQSVSRWKALPAGRRAPAPTRSSGSTSPPARCTCTPRSTPQSWQTAMHHRFSFNILSDL